MFNQKGLVFMLFLKELTCIKFRHKETAVDAKVSYVNSEGQELRSPKINSGNVGEGFETTMPEYQLAINGYTLKEIQEPAISTFRKEAQVYERSDAAPVTVRYQDSQGNQLSEPKILSGKIGLSCESEAKEITGWYVIETPSNASGIFSEEVQEVVYTYASQLENEEKNDDKVSENNY